MKIIFVLLLLFCSTELWAANITFHPANPEHLIPGRTYPATSSAHILIQGEIVPTDEKQFQSVVAQSEKSGARLVILDSNGGDVRTAMSIASHLRDHRLATLILDKNTCASACILILAGGVYRGAQDGAKLGLHRPYFTDNEVAYKKGYEQFKIKYEVVLNSHRDFFSRMGISNALLDTLVQIPSNDIRWIKPEFARRINLLGEDPAYAEWKRSERIAKEGSACVKHSDAMLKCFNEIGLENPRCDQIVGEPPRGCSKF